MTSYSVRWECRAHGSIGSFAAVQFRVEAETPQEAVDKARAIASETYELRFGGDYLGGEDRWLKPNGQPAASHLLPCQTEWR